MPVLTGQIVDLLSGAPVGGALVEYAGVAAVTDPGGRFVIAGAPSGASRQVVIEGAGVHARITYAEDGDALFEVVPAAFDMNAFDDVGRERGGRTIRWARSPVLYLDTRVPGDAPDPAEVARWMAEVEALAPSLVAEWTGGTFAAAPVLTGSAPPASGAIVFAFDEDPAHYPNDRAAGMTAVTWSTRGVIEAARVRLRFSAIAGLEGSHARRGMIAHELGHALGLGHMEGGQASVMSPVIHTPLLTALDRAAGRLLYRRPPGNTSLDRDPGASADLGLSSGRSASADWACAPASL